MRYQLYTLITLLILFSCMIYFGYLLYGMILFFCGAYAVTKSRREIAFLCCLGWGGLFLSLLIQREMPIVYVVSFPLMIFAFWEMIGIQKLSKSFPDSLHVADTKVKRISFSLASIFLIVLCSYLFLSSFYLAVPLLLVVILVLLFLLSLYLFVAKDL
jgi:hypothetical protein